MPSKAADRFYFYWDSCVFIDLIQGTPDRVDLLRELVELARRGDLVVVTSTLAIVETLRGPDPTELPAEQLGRIRAFFENEWIALRPVDRPIAERAAELRKAHGLPAADAVHLATALIAGVSEMQTFDQDHLLKLDGRVGSPPFRIVLPRHPVTLPLFDGTDSEASGAAQ